MKRRGNSLEPLGPMSATSNMVTKTAGEGFSVSTTHTLNFCTAASQLVKRIVVEVDVLAECSRRISPELHGFSACPLKIYSCTVPSERARKSCASCLSLSAVMSVSLLVDLPAAVKM